MLMKGTKIPNLPLSGHAPRFNGLFLGAFPILPTSFIQMNLAVIDLSCLQSNKPINRGENINLPVGDQSNPSCLSVFVSASGSDPQTKHHSLLKYLDIVWYSCAVHPTGHVHCVPPDIILGFSGSNHPRDHWPHV